MLLRLLGQNKLTFKQNNRRYVIEIFHSDMSRLNSVEFSRYLRMDFKDVIN